MCIGGSKYMDTLDIKENDAINDYFDVKLAEADNAIKNGAKFYTREEVDNILSTIMKKNVFA